MRYGIKSISVITLLVCFNILFAQNVEAKRIEVVDVTKVISIGKQNGIKVSIYQANKKDVEKAWSNKIRVATKSKVENQNNELHIYSTNISQISPNPINIYTIINEYPDYVEVNAFFELGTEFLSPRKNETAYLSARKFLRDFGIEQYKVAVDNELKGEEKKLKDLKGEMKKLVNENDKLYKNIGQEERDIERNKAEIETNKDDQQRTRGQIEHQKNLIIKMRDEEQKKDGEKILKGLESDLAKHYKANENMHKDIDKSQAKIRDYQRKIKSNEDEMARQQIEMDSQKNVILAVEKKLENIN